MTLQRFELDVLTVRKHGSVFSFKQVCDMLRSMINWRKDGEENHESGKLFIKHLKTLR